MLWKPHTNVVWIDEAGEIRLYDAQSGQFQTLNESGSHIWRLIMDGHDEEEVVAQLCPIYAAQTTTLQNEIRQDVQAYIRELVQAGLLIEDSDTVINHAR